jgi:uncharacterized protein (TIGR02996 family)
MSAELALLQDVIEHPEDNTPRLVLADWWDEYGTESQRARAELIRLQIEQTRLPGGAPRQRYLRRRQEQLLDEHGEDWLAELPALEGIRWEDEFVRGFVERVRADSPAAFHTHAPVLFAAAPLRCLALRGLNEFPAQFDLLGNPFLERVRELDLGNNQMIAGEWQMVFGSCLAQLTALLLHGNRLGDLGVELLARFAHYPVLAELYLSDNEIGQRGTARLASSSCFPALTLLDLRDNRIGNNGLAALAESSSLTGLRDLWLIDNRISEQGALALAPNGGQSRLPHLRSLWLNHNPIGDRPVIALAGDPARSALRDLDLRWCSIGDPGGRALVESPHLEALEQLNLTGNLISAPVLDALRERFGRRLVG